MAIYNRLSCMKTFLTSPCIICEDRNMALGRSSLSSLLVRTLLSSGTGSRIAHLPRRQADSLGKSPLRYGASFSKDITTWQTKWHAVDFTSEALIQHDH